MQRVKNDASLTHFSEETFVVGASTVKSVSKIDGNKLEKAIHIKTCLDSYSHYMLGNFTCFFTAN